MIQVLIRAEPWLGGCGNSQWIRSYKNIFISKLLYAGTWAFWKLEMVKWLKTPKKCAQFPVWCNFCLRPSAKHQGITWVVVVVLLLVLVLVVLHLVHFLITRNLRGKKTSQPGFEPGIFSSTAQYLPTELRCFVVFMYDNYLLISKITPQTLDQYWSTLVFIESGAGLAAT